jgi:multidrug resistance efflux pump
VQAAAGSSSSAAEEVSRLAELHARGVLTDEEFQQAKSKALA